MKKIYLICLLVTIVFFSCNIEGIGGRCTIKGKVKIQMINLSNGNIIAEAYSPKQDVYIEYGDNSYFDDEIKTDKDGEFQFPFLHKGIYRVYVYSQCIITPPDSCLLGKEAILQEVELTKSGETTIQDIVIKSYL